MWIKLCAINYLVVWLVRHTGLLPLDIDEQIIKCQLLTTDITIALPFKIKA